MRVVKKEDEMRHTGDNSCTRRRYILCVVRASAPRCQNCLFVCVSTSAACRRCKLNLSSFLHRVLLSYLHIYGTNIIIIIISASTFCHFSQKIYQNVFTYIFHYFAPANIKILDVNNVLFESSVAVCMKKYHAHHSRQTVLHTMAQFAAAVSDSISKKTRFTFAYRRSSYWANVIYSMFSLLG